MSAAAASGQPGNKRPRSSEGQDNTTHAGSRGGAGSGPLAASPPPSRSTCVTDSFREAAVTACTKTVYKLKGLAKKAFGFRQSVASLEKALADGDVPVTLKVQLPKAYELHVGAASQKVSACVSALQIELLKESLEAKKVKQAAAESELADPDELFKREYCELVLLPQLPDDLAVKAKAVWEDQVQVFQFEWLKAKADLARKSEQASASRMAAAEAQAQASMEIEALPSRELIDDLVQKRVAAALQKERARAQTSATASAGSGNDGKAKAMSKADADPTHGGASGSNKGKKKSKKRAKGSKNANRK